MTTEPFGVGNAHACLKLAIGHHVSIANSHLPANAGFYLLCTNLSTLIPSHGREWHLVCRCSRTFIVYRTYGLSCICTFSPLTRGFISCVIYMVIHMTRNRVSRPTVSKPIRVLKPYVQFNGRRGWHVVIRDRDITVNPMAR